MMANTEDLCCESSVLILLQTSKFEEALNLVRKDISKVPSDTSSLVSILISKLIAANNEINGPVYAILMILADHFPCDDIMIDIIDADPPLNNPSVFKVIVELYLLILSRKSPRFNILFSWSLSSVASAFPDVDDEINNMHVHEIFEVWKSFYDNVLVVTSRQSSDNLKYLCCSSIIKILECKIPEELHIESIKLCLGLNCNLSYLLDNVTLTKNGNFHYCYDNEVPDASVGILLYYCLKGNVNIPLIYSYSYLFINSLPAILGLLNSNEQLYLEMGTSLIELLVLPLENSLSLTEIHPFLGSVLERLNYIMVFGENERLRKVAFLCFNAVIVCYDMKGQYNIYLNFRSFVSHSGTQAHLISRIKSNFDSTLKSSKISNSSSFSGKRLEDLLKLYCFLNNGAKTNLVEDAEQILASLNFFWYLLLLHSNKQICLSSLKELLVIDYITTLQQLVNDSLAYCETELSTIEMGTESSTETPIYLKNIELKKLSKEDKLKSIFCSRNVIELIKDGLNRILSLL